jgi:hypothetical protein
VIRSGDLQLQDTDLALYSETPPRELEPSPAPTGARPQSPARRTSTEPPLYADARRRLAECLRDEITAARSSGARMGPPLGKWLARDLVLEAFEQSGRVAARAAQALQSPETTFSRRLRQAEGELETARVPASWASVQSSLADWLRASGRPEGNVVDQADDLLLGLILDQVSDVAQAACLMGVTVPTMKRRLGEFRRDGGSSTDDVLHAVGSFKA